MSIEFGHVTETCSLADIVRAVKHFGEADEETRARIYRLFGARLTPIPIERDITPRLSLLMESPDSTEHEEIIVERPKTIEFRRKPDVHKIETDDFVESDWKPLRLGDQPAQDILPLHDETSPAGAEQIVPADPAPLFEPAKKLSKPRLVPLLDPLRANNILRELCARKRRGSVPDLARLVSDVARGKPLPVNLPYKFVRRPARRIVVASDATDRMTTFLEDCKSVATQVRKATNSQVSEESWTELEDLIDTPESADEAPPDLPPGSHVLLLSDLGFGDWARENSWRLPNARRLCRLAENFASKGVSLSALIPVSSARLQARLPKGLAGIAWDRGSSPTAARRAVDGKFRHPVAGSAEDDREKIRAESERIALTAIYCQRVTPLRLRALRVALLPRTTPEQEALAWHSRYFTRYPSGVATVNHIVFDRTRAIPWSLLIAFFRNKMPWVLARWPALRPDEAVDAEKGVVRPRDWAKAREALAQALGEPALYSVLGKEFPTCEAELSALRDGRGCVIEEQAEELARLYPTGHVLEPLERRLLWEAYLEKFPDAEKPLRATLSRLLQALPGGSLHADEDEAALEFVRYRLPVLPRIIQIQPEAQKLADEARELLGYRPPVQPPQPEEKLLYTAAGVRQPTMAQREENCDLFAWGSGEGAWWFWIGDANLAPQSTSLPLRMRVRALPQFNISLSNEWGGTQELKISVMREPQHRVLKGTVTAKVGELKFALKSEENHDPQFWLDHAASARSECDWTAATRWARKAASLCDRSAPILAFARAAAISEVGVDEALEKLDKLRTRKPMLGILAHLDLLEIDSRLEELRDFGRAQFEVLQPETSLAACVLRLRIASRLVRAARRQFKVSSEWPLIRAAIRDLRRALADPRTHTVRFACVEALGALIGAAIDAGWPKRAREMLEAADGLRRPGDDEVDLVVEGAHAVYEDYYAKATQALARHERTIALALQLGRGRELIETGINYCRTLYNGARIPKAEKELAVLESRASARRSISRMSLIWSERAYQLRFIGGGEEIPYARGAYRTTPAQELRAEMRATEVSPHWFERVARDRKKSRIEVLQDIIRDTRTGGARFWEMVYAHDLLQELPTEGSPRDPDKPPVFVRNPAEERRAHHLAVKTGRNLGAANALEMVARHEFPRWAAKWKMLERFDPNELFTKAISICDEIQVVASVLLFNKYWAEQELEFGDPRRAKELADKALRYGARLENVEREYGLMCTVQARTLRALGMPEEAKVALLATYADAQLAPNQRGLEPTLDALSGLAMLAVDEGNWGAALGYMDLVEDIGSSQPIYTLPKNSEYIPLLIDIIDGRGLARLEAKLAEKEPIETLEPAGAGAKARKFREKGRREREKAKRASVWRSYVPHAACLFRTMLTWGNTLEASKDVPFNDLWYYGQKLMDAGAPHEAVYFLGQALEREKNEAGISKVLVKHVMDLLEKSQKLAGTIPIWQAHVSMTQLTSSPWSKAS